MIEDRLRRRAALISNTKVVKNLSNTARDAFTSAIQKVDGFEKLSEQHQKIIIEAEREPSESRFRFVLDVDECGN